MTFGSAWRTCSRRRCSSPQSAIASSLRWVRLDSMTDRAPRATMHVLPGHGHICLIAPDIDLSCIVDQWRALQRR